MLRESLERVRRDASQRGVRGAAGKRPEVVACRGCADLPSVVIMKKPHFSQKRKL